MTEAPRSGHMLQVSDLRHVYGSGDAAFVALDGLDVDVDRGEFVSIVGPSGCGKTTLLRCIAGLITPTAGRLVLDGQPVEGVHKDLALVFQDYSRSLFPWMSVRRNVRFPLRNLPAEERARRIDESLAAVGLEGAGEKYPWQLSGGMQQRVAIARALAYRPKILLMDEPFASVDAQTRADLEDLVLEIWQAFDATILFVTHDIDEAVYLSDRVVVLTRSPATVEAVIETPLPRPRDQIETREREDFAHLRADVARLIRSRTRDSATRASRGVTS